MESIGGNIPVYFEEIETTEPYKGYYFKVKDVLTIAILGTLCELKNMKIIHDWAKSPLVSEFLQNEFGIWKTPCYMQFTNIMGIINPEKLNEAFIKWTYELAGSIEGKTISFDGKTICSTEKMEAFESPLHIVSAYISDMGLTLGQKSVCDKSNEIPAVQNLIEMLNISGAMVVADALNCQKKTAEKIIKGGGDYLLSVKDNHRNLYEEIVDFVQNEDCKNTMKTCKTIEKNRDRIEKRIAFTTAEIDWMECKSGWKSLASIGAINTQFTSKKGMTNEWHYYISSKELTPEELLKHARLEWGVEAMHWLLDVHFDEDRTRANSQITQENLNIIRKITLNLVKKHKQNTVSKQSLASIMRSCLFDTDNILKITSDLLKS